MKNPFKRERLTVKDERDRLVRWLNVTDPISDEYHTALQRLNELDKIHNRTTEFRKTVIPAAATIISMGGIYALQQFAGVIVPKALDALASRSTQKKSHDSD